MKINFLVFLFSVNSLFTISAKADQIGRCKDGQGHDYAVQYEASGIATVVSYKDDSGKRIFEKNPLLNNVNFVTVFSFPNGDTFVVGSIINSGNAYLFTNLGQTSYSLDCT
jgi:hypothetical protein